MNLDGLIKLQAIDSQLQEIEELKGDLPAQVNRLVLDLEALDQERAEQAGRLKENGAKQRQLNATISAAKEQLKKYQDQLILVSTNRAYDALTAEIDSARKEKDENEYGLLELIEEAEQLTAELKSGELTAIEKRSSLEKQEADLKETVAETEALHKRLIGKRRKVERSIEPRILGVYHRTLDARDGEAVVPLTRGACGSCFHRIPTQLGVEIRTMERIITCDACGAILYWKDEVQ